MESQLQTHIHDILLHRRRSWLFAHFVTALMHLYVGDVLIQTRAAQRQGHIDVT